MNAPVVPQRIRPLTWRRPSVLWTPLALAVAIGWPAALFYNEVGLQRLVLVLGAAVFAVALITLGISWMLGRAPKARRVVVLHVVIAGALASLAAPFVITQALEVVAQTGQAGATPHFSFTMTAAMTPLALVVGLPLTLISGIVFAWTALATPRAPRIRVAEVQPFD